EQRRKAEKEMTCISTQSFLRSQRLYFPQDLSVKRVFAIARTIVLICRSFLFRPSVVALVELLLKLAFRLEPIVQVAAVNSATLDVNLKRSLTNFGQRWPIVATFFRDV